jgi:hypothetical protein
MVGGNDTERPTDKKGGSPNLAMIIMADNPAEKMRFCPELRKERDCVVFNDASWYPFKNPSYLICMYVCMYGVCMY